MLSPSLARVARSSISHALAGATASELGVGGRGLLTLQVVY